MQNFTDDFKHRLYATFLLLAHLTGWAFIYIRKDFLLPIDYRTAVCWPFFSECQSLLVNIQPLVQPWLIFAIGMTTFLTFSVWNSKIDSKARRFIVLIVLIIHLSFLILDYRMKMNQHIMHFTIDLAFIFFAKPQWLIRALLIAFYFWAGLLKFHPDWISGLALYGDPIFISKNYFPLATKYVLLLELIFTWFLLSKKSVIRFFTLFQLILFHFVSWTVVDFYYPLLMYCLLSVFVIYNQDFSSQKFKIQKINQNKN